MRSLLKWIFKIFSFLPFVKSFTRKKYYLLEAGVYFLNLFFQKILRINNEGSFLMNYNSRATKGKNIRVKQGEKSFNVYLSLASSGGCYYQAINNIEFGEGTIWANNCSFISANHSFKDLDKHTKNDILRIGSYVWIGSNCVVLPNCNIGDYSIIGAGSIVNKQIPSHSIAVGNPIRIVAKRCIKCLDKISLKENNNLCKDCR